MDKWLKKVLGLAAASGAIAGLIYYLKKKDSDKDDEFADDFEDNDFDLDSDLKPTSDREYVSLNPSAKEDADNSKEVASEESASDETVSGKTASEDTSDTKSGEE